MVKGGAFMGNVWSAMVACVPYSLSSRNSVLVMGDILHAWCQEMKRASIFSGYVFGKTMVDDAQLSWVIEGSY